MSVIRWPPRTYHSIHGPRLVGGQGARSAVGAAMDPEDLPELARVWASPEEPPQRRRQALGLLVRAYCGVRAEVAPLLAACLSPLVRTLARSVARNASRTVREDFVAGALTLLLAPQSDQAPARICSYEPERGSPARWLARVLRNCWLSERRRDRLAAVSLIEREVGPPASALSWDDVAFDLASPFSAADLERIGAWDCRPRVELLTMAGLWAKVPPESWVQWLEAYEDNRELGLPRPFPPKSFLDLDNPQDRTAPLAELLAYPPNTLTQRWRRGQKLLNGLDFIREISAGPDRRFGGSSDG
jgi:hypothetical protein